MDILVLNSGSSSIKFNFWSIEDKKLLCKGLIEKIGKTDSSMTYYCGEEKLLIEQQVLNHKEGIDLVIKTISDPEKGVIKSLDEIKAVGHRVVHGGENITKSEIITPEIKKMQKFLKRF